jgi:hypothetical protein
MEAIPDGTDPRRVSVNREAMDALGTVVADGARSIGPRDE